MSDSIPPSGPEEVDPNSALSLASASLDGELSDAQFAAAQSAEVTAQRHAVQEVTQVIRSAPLPSPPPGLAASQIAQAMSHFAATNSTATATPAADTAAPAVTIDLTERRLAKQKAAQEEQWAQAQQRNERSSRRLQLLTRVAGVVLVVGLFGGLAATIGNGSGGDDTDSAASDFAADGDDSGGATATTAAAAAGGEAESAPVAADSGSDDSADASIEEEVAAFDGDRDLDNAAAAGIAGPFTLEPIAPGSVIPEPTFGWDASELYVPLLAGELINASRVRSPEPLKVSGAVGFDLSRAECQGDAPPGASGVVPVVEDDRILEFFITGADGQSGILLDPNSNCESATTDP